MSRAEFNATIGTYLSELWPGFKLNATQADVWYSKLRWDALPLVKSAMAEAYASGTWREPTLAGVLAELKTLRRGDTADLDRRSEARAEHDRLAMREAVAMGSVVEELKNRLLLASPKAAPADS